MKERPILMSAPMVRACLDGSKTQTRRIIKPQPGGDLKAGVLPMPSNAYAKEETSGLWSVRSDHAVFRAGDRYGAVEYWREWCRYGKPGDTLWVREASMIQEGALLYRADFDDCGQCPAFGMDGAPLGIRVTPKEPWKPSIHMPRWACRLRLEITEVRVQRLQDIDDNDAISEGLSVTSGGWTLPEWGHYHESPIDAYCYLWNKINGHGSWGWNPWVWVVSFKVADAAGLLNTQGAAK